MSLAAVGLFGMLYWAYRSDCKLKKWRDSLQPGLWVRHIDYGESRIMGTPAGDYVAIRDFDGKRYVTQITNIYPL